MLFFAANVFGQNEHRPVTSSDARTLEPELRRVWHWLSHSRVQDNVPSRREGTEGEHFLYVRGAVVRAYWFADNEWLYADLSGLGTYLLKSELGDSLGAYWDSTEVAAAISDSMLAGKDSSYVTVTADTFVLGLTVPKLRVRQNALVSTEVDFVAVYNTGVLPSGLLFYTKTTGGVEKLSAGFGPENQVLYYDGVQKFSTRSTGAEVEGSLDINDSNTRLSEDGSSNMILTDAVTGSKTLAELAAEVDTTVLATRAWVEERDAEITFQADDAYTEETIYPEEDSVYFKGGEGIDTYYEDDYTIRFSVDSGKVATQTDIANKQDDSDTSTTDATRYWVGEQNYVAGPNPDVSKVTADTVVVDTIIVLAENDEGGIWYDKDTNTLYMWADSQAVPGGHSSFLKIGGGGSGNFQFWSEGKYVLDAGCDYVWVTEPMFVGEVNGDGITLRPDSTLSKWYVTDKQVYLYNMTQDKDLHLGVNDGGVYKLGLTLEGSTAYARANYGFNISDVGTIKEDAGVTDWLRIASILNGKGIYFKANETGGTERYIAAFDAGGASIYAHGKTMLYVDSAYVAIQGKNVGTGQDASFRFYEGADYVGFKAPNLSGSSYVWTLPTNNVAGYFYNNGSGVCSWGTTVPQLDATNTWSASQYFQAGFAVGALADENTIDDAPHGTGSTQMWIGNAAILTSLDSSFVKVTADTFVLGLTVPKLKVRQNAVVSTGVDFVASYNTGVLPSGLLFYTKTTGGVEKLSAGFGPENQILYYDGIERLSTASSGIQVRDLLDLEDVATGGASMRLREGADYVGFKAPNLSGSSYVWTLPSNNVAGYFYNNGSGVVSWDTTVPILTASNTWTVAQIFSGGFSIGGTTESRIFDDSPTGSSGSTQMFIGQYSIDVTNPSDRRVKYNIRPTRRGLGDLMRMKVVDADYFAGYGGRDETVLIAQDLQEVYPAAVAMRADGLLEIDYEKLVPLMVQSIQDLKNEVEDLKRKVK